MKVDKNFWSEPDSWFSAVILNEQRKQAYARVKNNLALIQSLPDAETGIHYQDILEVSGPCGEQLYRDDLISEYKSIKIHQPSDNLTFKFQAIISNSSEYFDLKDWFTKYNQVGELVFKGKYEKEEWLNCYCSAKSVSQVEQILSDFKSWTTGNLFERLIGDKKSNFRFKEIKVCK